MMQNQPKKDETESFFAEFGTFYKTRDSSPNAKMSDASPATAPRLYTHVKHSTPANPNPRHLNPPQQNAGFFNTPGLSAQDGKSSLQVQKPTYHRATPANNPHPSSQTPMKTYSPAFSKQATDRSPNHPQQLSQNPVCRSFSQLTTAA